MAWRFALLLAAASLGWACMCSGTWLSARQAWRAAPAVFLGTVETADPDRPADETIFREQFVRIRVEEAFKGVSRGEIIELHQGANDCAAKFRTGEKGVFYLYGKAGAWVVPPCTRAMGSPNPAGDDLLFLRGLPQSVKGTRLSGEVEYYRELPEGFHRVAGLANVAVTISGPRGFTRQLRTNAAGVFEVYGLEPATYSVAIEAPKGLRLKFPVTYGSDKVPGDEAAVILQPDGSAGVSFVLQDDTSVSGRVLDAMGRALTGVCFVLEPLEGRGKGGFFSCSQAGGGFQMEMMPPGKYWLVAHDKVTPGGLKSESTLYYPGVRDRQRATPISIREGEHLTLLPTRLPSEEKRYRVAGRLQFADGVPAGDATVRFSSPQHGYTETVRTGADGSFAMSVVADMEGELSGSFTVFNQVLASCPGYRAGPRGNGLLRSINSRPMTLSTGEDREGLVIELASSSCKGPPAAGR